MELYSPPGVVIWNIVKLTLMPLDPKIKKQTEECLPMFHIPWNYVRKEEFLYGT